MDSEIAVSLVIVLLLAFPSIYISKALCLIVLTFMDPANRVTLPKESKPKKYRI